jgi:Ca2+/H+ antiporter, TMEM165/GDT1 family
MSAFLFTLVAVVVAGLGARDQTLLAALTARHGPRVAVLIVAVVVSIATVAIAAWLWHVTAPLLVGEARTLLVAMALALAGIEALVMRTKRTLEEPTHSLGALGVVLFARQATDSARLLVFALALGTGSPVIAGLGGAIGAAVSAGIGWGMGETLVRPALATVRRLIGTGLLLVGIALGLVTKGWL